MRGYRFFPSGIIEGYTCLWNDPSVQLAQASFGSCGIFVDRESVRRGCGLRSGVMIKSINIVMFLTDGFGSLGGMAKFNRDFMQALDASALTERVYALPRLIPDPIDEPVQESVVYDRKAAAGKVAFLRRILWYAWQGSKPDLVICGHLNLLLAAWLLARFRGARLALIIHGVEAWKRRGWLYRFMLRWVDSTVAVSRYTAGRFSTWSKVSHDQVFILPNCVDLDLFAPERRNMNLAERYDVQDNKVIITVGRLASLERYKGFDEVIEAMPELIRRFPTLKYMIVGDGSDRKRLEGKARSLGLSNQVIFTGRIPENEKALHYNLADAYVMPSYGEGFGIVLIEAAACGVPVIGSRADGSREALLDGRLGDLVDPRVPGELIGAVSAALASGRLRERNDAIIEFDVAHFRVRVAQWLEQQAGVENEIGEPNSRIRSIARAV
jgi:phosphatidylinositol alpha-1,6-mannosyltransferase